MIRCSECGLDADEFVVATERWGYWSDGRGLLPFCPECALRVNSRPTLARAHDCLAFCVATPVGRILDLQPSALVRP